MKPQSTNVASAPVERREQRLARAAAFASERGEVRPLSERVAQLERQLAGWSRAPIERRAWSVADFASAYGLSEESVRKLLNSGELRSVYICGRRLIPVEAVDDLLKRSECRPADKRPRGRPPKAISSRSGETA
jgi:hypothetical protein